MRVRWCKDCDEIVLGDERCRCLEKHWTERLFIWIMALGAGILLGLAFGRIWP
jgi:hypothetical protein